MNRTDRSRRGRITLAFVRVYVCICSCCNIDLFYFPPKLNGKEQSCEGQMSALDHCEDLTITIYRPMFFARPCSILAGLICSDMRKQICSITRPRTYGRASFVHSWYHQFKLRACLVLLSFTIEVVFFAK